MQVGMQGPECSEVYGRLVKRLVLKGTGNTYGGCLRDLGEVLENTQERFN